MTESYLFLMRHGRTRWNADGRLQGRQNSALLDSGRPAILAIAQSLARERRVDAVYASPLRRCVETATLVCRPLGLDYQLSDALMECDMGQCEGLTWAEAQAQFPDMMALRAVEKWTTAWPRGEAYQDVYARAQGFAAALPWGQNALCIGHETLNKCLVGACLGWAPERIMALRQANHELIILGRRDKTFAVVPFAPEGVGPAGE